MKAEQTRMFREAAEAPAVVQRQLERNRGAVARIAGRLRNTEPRFVITVARGNRPVRVSTRYFVKHAA